MIFKVFLARCFGYLVIHFCFPLLFYLIYSLHSLSEHRVEVSWSLVKILTLGCLILRPFAIVLPTLYSEYLLTQMKTYPAHPAPTSRNVPGPTSRPNIIQHTSVQKSKPAQSAPQSAPKPIQATAAPATNTQKAPMQSAPKPVIQPAPQPLVKPAAAQPAAQPATQPTAAPAHRPTSLNRDLLSMEPLPIISTPTMVATPVSQDTEMANSGFGTAPAPDQAPTQVPQERQAVPVAPASSKIPITDLVLNAPAAVREAIKINQSGKPVLWNYMTEAPSVRELSKSEKEGLRALPPPGPGDRLPWTRAWHPSDQPLRIGPNGEIIHEEFVLTVFNEPLHATTTLSKANTLSSSTMPMKPVIGLMGSRHA